MLFITRRIKRRVSQSPPICSLEGLVRWWILLVRGGGIRLWLPGCVIAVTTSHVGELRDRGGGSAGNSVFVV